MSPLDPQRLKTVPELVAFMHENHLRFARALNGDEGSYVALHKALVLCDTVVESKGEANPALAERGDL
jgi:hypothetical protein